MTHQHNRQLHGFTLIELSIVLVIIGLIVGGVLVGKNLIRSAELKSIITDEQKYISAVNTFRSKYNALPGDMVNATSIWGTDPQGCPDYGPFTGPPQAGTCNGNGDGLIENIGTGSANAGENYRAWQQLGTAGFIAGAYTGTPGPTQFAQEIPGRNAPPTRIPNGGFEWVSFNASAIGVGPTYFNADYNTQYLMVGAQAAGNQDLTSALLTPLDAQAIDQKMDDGMPWSGSVLAGDNWDGTYGCMNFNNPPQYWITAGPVECSLLFTVKSW